MRAALVVVALLLVAWEAADGAPAAGPGAEEVMRIKREEQFCVPNSTFQLDCNECICEPHGQAASCTAMDCPDRRRRRRDVSCQPGTTLRRETCETCICLDDGKTLTCTDVLCSKGNS